VSAAQAQTLAGSESERTDQAVASAHVLVNPSAGILGVMAGKSSDRIGEGAVIVYVAQGAHAPVPQTISGVRTVVIPTTAQALAYGQAPATPQEAGMASLPAAVLNQAIAVKQHIAARLMKQNPSFFGVGVGQSLDNPKEAALVIYVDRRQVPATLTPVLSGLRVHYIIMERLHVTRSYATGLESHSRCMSRRSTPGTGATNPFGLHTAPRLEPF
jgi:hypothetical protein